MKREGKKIRKRDREQAVTNNNTEKPKIMSSNLPLLFANGRPRSLDTISQSELEEFVPFMILCSLGQELHLKPKEIKNCPVPEWWPTGFPFKFPLVDRSDWNSRQVMLKSLVCRCYTFYDCEFLLKFSSELAEMAPARLKFEGNKDENTTSIYDASGSMLVKCRNENLNYDMHKNRRRYLSPTHRSSLNQAKKFEPVIDLTFDTSSEDEKEVYFKEAPAARKATKRKGSVETSEESASKQKHVKRMFQDFPEEIPEPTDHNQESFMARCGLIPKGKKIVKEYVLQKERRKRLIKRFTLISITSQRGQDLLARNMHSFNLEASLDRINRYCGPIDQQAAENNQVCTRASTVLSARYKDDANQQSETDEEPSKKDDDKWCHVYKWPHRTNKTSYPYKGPSLKPCSVVLKLLSRKVIYAWTKRKRTISTMTPEGWLGSEIPICACQKIPLIVLDDEPPSRYKYKDKSSSTRCTCIRSNQQYTPSLQIKKSPVEIKNGNRDMQVNQNSESSMKARHRGFSQSQSQGSGSHNVSGSGLSRSVNRSVSYDKAGLSVICYNATLQSESSVDFKTAFHRRPLAVVPSAPVVIQEDIPDTLYRSYTCLPQASVLKSSIKFNFNRSVLDAIKWYTKVQPVLEPSNLVNDRFVKEEIIVIGSQENIKPSAGFTLPNLTKPINYFMRTTNITERDYCFKRSSDGTTKLVTRRGERHFINREPCPSCFQGRDNFCVYEFIRQAKVAGVTLHKNQKQLQLMFFKFIQSVNSKS